MLDVEDLSVRPLVTLQHNPSRKRGIFTIIILDTVFRNGRATKSVLSNF
jgi:hypothetical protein